MKRETKSALRRLQELKSDGDHNLYERLSLAAGVVEDAEYLNEFHAGDQDQAMEVLEESYFRALGGYVRLHVLLAIYREFPAESQWQEYHYDLRAMELLWRDRKASRDSLEQAETAKPRVRATVAEVQELRDRSESLAYQLRRERETTAAKDSELERLRQRVHDLEQQVAELRGRLSAFEQMRGAA